MVDRSQLPPKKDVALALLERSTVLVHLDPRLDAVRVPPWFKKQPQLVLQIGHGMAVPIPDLLIDEEGMSCTLSFSRKPFPCFMPWEAVYALVGEDGRGMVWPEDVPSEVSLEAGANAGDKERTDQEKKRGRKDRAHLRSVGADEGAPEPKEEEAPRPGVAVLAEANVPAERKEPRPAPVLAEASAPVEEEEFADEAASAPTATPAKKKRELPPYLRVVK